MNLVTQGNLNIEHFNIVDGKLNVIFPTVEGYNGQ